MTPAQPTPPKRRPRMAPKMASLSPPPIRVIVAESQAIDRGGLVGLIDDQRDLEVVGEAATVEETIQQCTTLKPDVLVMAMSLGGQESMPALKAIREALPGIKVLALADRSVDRCVVLNPPSRKLHPGEVTPACAVGTDCLRLAVVQGAMATMRRSADPEELFRAIRAVAEGNAWFDSGTADLMRKNGIAEKGHTPDGPKLTERELEVAALIADGYSNKEISTTLSIGEATVKKHIGHILVKLSLADRLQVGLYLARNPLVLRSS
jgi:NarL family two-component system response regulator LiaR